KRSSSVILCSVSFARASMAAARARASATDPTTDPATDPAAVWGAGRTGGGGWDDAEGMIRGGAAREHTAAVATRIYFPPRHSVVALRMDVVVWRSSCV